jgi:hypothetical protein
VDSSATFTSFSTATSGPRTSSVFAFSATGSAFGAGVAFLRTAFFAGDFTFLLESGFSALIAAFF